MSASLEVTVCLTCPNRCRYCPRGHAVAAYCGPWMLSREDFTRYCRTVPPEVAIQFNGAGEPFGNPACADMILDRHKEGHLVNVYTTLVGASAWNLDRIGGVPFGSFCVHVPDDMGLSAMPLAAGSEYRAALESVVRRPPMTNPRFVIHGGGVREDLRDILPAAERQPIRPFAGLNEHMIPRGDHDWTVCRASGGAFDHNHLMPDGTVYVCCHDWDLRNPIGNLGTDSWKDLRRGPIPLCRLCEYAI